MVPLVSHTQESKMSNENTKPLGIEVGVLARRTLPLDGTVSAQRSPRQVGRRAHDAADQRWSFWRLAGADVVAMKIELQEELISAQPWQWEGASALFQCDQPVKSETTSSTRSFGTSFCHQ